MTQQQPYLIKATDTAANVLNFHCPTLEEAQQLAKTLLDVHGCKSAEIALNIPHSVYEPICEDFFGVLSPEGWDIGEGFDTREEAEKIAAQFDRELLEEANQFLTK